MGDVLVQVLWYIHTDGIINVKISNADADTYRFDPTEMLLAW